MGTFFFFTFILGVLQQQFILSILFCFFKDNFVYLLNVKYISVRKFLYISESQPGVILRLFTSGGIWQCLEMFFGCHN